MSDELKKVVEYMQKYTRDFKVIDRPGKHTLHKGFSNEFDFTLDEGEIIASYKYEDGEVGVFWGGQIRFILHGEVCVLLPDGITAPHHSGDDLMIFYRNGYADAASSVSYGPKFAHI